MKISKSIREVLNQSEKALIDSLALKKLQGLNRMQIKRLQVHARRLYKKQSDLLKKQSRNLKFEALQKTKSNLRTLKKVEVFRDAVDFLEDKLARFDAPETKKVSSTLKNSSLRKSSQKKSSIKPTKKNPSLKNATLISNAAQKQDLEGPELVVNASAHSPASFLSLLSSKKKSRAPRSSRKRTALKSQTKRVQSHQRAAQKRNQAKRDRRN